tara:strand:- start:641 stop:766 length:126 start_codon:yes stop_codon:yes gene_type:complete
MTQQQPGPRDDDRDDELIFIEQDMIEADRLDRDNAEGGADG